MRRNRRVAITGGIGSGKSAVCAQLRAWGYPVFSCDEISHELRRDRSYLDGLEALFPGTVCGGSLDARALADRVFAREEEVKKLNAYSHPRIMAELFAQMDCFPVAFAEVPLLYEGGWERSFDDVIALVRPQEKRIAAVMARDRLSRQEVLLRIHEQLGEEALQEKGCLLLCNDGTPAELSKKLRAALDALGID